MAKKFDRKEKNFHRKANFIRGIASPQAWNEWQQALVHRPIGFAFVGRSNVGKSSLLNALFGHKNARVSNTPGRTREINIFEFRLSEEQQYPFFAFDLPGYGFAEVSRAEKRKWEDLIQTFFDNCGKDIFLLNIQDARHPLSKTDQDFLDFIFAYRPTWAVLFNKMDKLKTQSERHSLEIIKSDLMKEMKGAKQVHFISAETNQGIDGLEVGLLSFLSHYLSQS